jgi:hypothetical protein
MNWRLIKMLPRLRQIQRRFASVHRIAHLGRACDTRLVRI